MDYRQADRTIRAFKQSRAEWIDILQMSGGEATHAAEHIVRINAKIELLRGIRTPYPDDYEGEYE